MSIWKDQGPAKKEAVTPPTEPTPAGMREAPAVADFSPTVTAPPGTRAPERTPQETLKESLIAADLTIEGKIEGTGDVRIAGRFKGDVNVQGNLTIEHGAKLNGGVRAQQVLVSGELEGNIESASLVELRDSAVLTGDLKAGSLTVASGSKIRGHIECGWGDVKPGPTPGGNAKDKAANDKSSD